MPAVTFWLVPCDRAPICLTPHAGQISALTLISLPQSVQNFVERPSIGTSSDNNYVTIAPNSPRMTWGLVTKLSEAMEHRTGSDLDLDKPPLYKRWQSLFPITTSGGLLGSHPLSPAPRRNRKRRPGRLSTTLVGLPHQFKPIFSSGCQCLARPRSGVFREPSRPSVNSTRSWLRSLLARDLTIPGC